VLVPEVDPDEGDEEGEGDQRIEPAEGVLADAGDEALPDRQARDRVL